MCSHALELLTLSSLLVAAWHAGPTAALTIQGHRACASVSPESREGALALLPTVSGQFSWTVSGEELSHRVCLLCSLGLPAAPAPPGTVAPPALMATVIRGDFSQLLVLGELIRGDGDPAHHLGPGVLWPPAPCALCWASTPGQLHTALSHSASPQQSHWQLSRSCAAPRLPWGQQAQGAPCSPSPLTSSSVDACSNGFVQQLPAITRLQLIQINEMSQPQQSEQKPD